MDQNIFDLSPEAFQAAIAELRTMGYDTDDLTRQYRSANSPFASINNAADNFQQGLADEGRRSVLGGLLSKVEGSTGMDAIRGLNFEGLGGLLGAGQAVGRAIDAPGAAYQGLIPRGDMAGEALNVAGMAMGAGGAATAPGGALRMGLAREGLSEAQRQARDILNMRAAGRAGDVTDDMMARADPQYMYDNTPLPMDEASRLARADAAGFNRDVFHGGDGRGFDRNFSDNSTPYFAYEGDTASDYAADRGGADSQVGRVFVRAENRAQPDDVFSAYESVSGMDRQFFDGDPSWMPMNDTYSDYVSQIEDSLRKDGFDSVYFPDDSTPISGEEVSSIAMLSPATNIRSRFARFDPEFSHLSNLSAANASPAGLLAMQPEQETRPLPFMEMLRGLLQ
jgi:hypothetical protein